MSKGSKGLVNYKFQVVDPNGNPIPSGLSVTITNSVGATLTIYKEDQSTSLTNPILSAALDVTTEATPSFWYSPGGVYATVYDGYQTTRHGPIKEYDHRIVVPYTTLWGGTGSTHISKTLANLKFIEIRHTNLATSGDNRLLYMQFKLGGAGGGGECLRAWTVVDSVAGGTAHGAHLSLSFGATGSITGLGVAARATLHMANAAMPSGGTYAAIQPEIWSDGASTTVSAVTQLSFIRCVNGGNATGVGLVDDKAYLLVLDGVTEGAGNMVVASATEANYASSARCLVNGVEKWLMFASASG